MRAIWYPGKYRTIYAILGGYTLSATITDIVFIWKLVIEFSEIPALTFRCSKPKFFLLYGRLYAKIGNMRVEYIILEIY